jgi:hypothetical protein
VAVVGLVTAGGAAGQAVVLKDFGCGIFTVPGGGTVISDRSHSVVTPSGNANLVCHAELPAGAPETITFESVCFTFGGVTTGHNVVTKSGQVHLTCHFKP